MSSKFETKKILITGAAGFVGSFLTKQLLDNNQRVVAIDNLNDYYDVNLKKARLKMIEGHENCTFIEMDIENKEEIFRLFEDHNFDIIINLAAQAGVRYKMVPLSRTQN